MKIAIIGAGFAGLASAILLSSKHQVEVFEKYPADFQAGAGIMLQPSIWPVLQEMGIYEEVLSMAEKIHFIDGQDLLGRHVFSTSYSHSSSHGVHGLGILRGTFLHILYKQACMQHVTIHHGTHIESVSELKQSHDLVIVANGVHSQLCHELPIKRSCKPYPWGCLWTVVPEKYSCRGFLKQYLHGSRHMMGLLPSGNKNGQRMLSIFWSVERSRHEAKGVAISPEDLSLMEQFITHPNLMKHIGASQFTFASYSDIWMQDYYHDNIVVMGDAAHAMSPQLGQGANMALLDAFELHRSMEKLPLALALASFNEKRKQHIAYYRRASRFLTPLFQSNNPLHGAFRDMLFGVTAKIPFSRRLCADILTGKKNYTTLPSE